MQLAVAVAAVRGHRGHSETLLTVQQQQQLLVHRSSTDEAAVALRLVYY
jgi:hypothetical protein